MITSGLVVDNVGHGLQTHLPYNHQAVAAAVHNHRMSYVEPSAYLKSVVPPPPSPQLQQQQQQSSEPPATPEFLRPLPKPAPVNPLKAPRASSKYAAATTECRPVNLTATKEPLAPPPPPPTVEHHLRLDDRHHPYPVYGHPRLYVSASPYHHPYPMHQPPAPYGVYTSPYAPIIPRETRHHLMQPPPQERRYPSPPKNGCGGGIGVSVGSHTSPSSSPPEQFKVPNGRDNKPPQPQQQLQRILPPPPPPPTSTFAALAVNNSHINSNVVVAAAEPSPKKSRRNTPEPLSPPAISAVKTANFTKGSLIRLANGNIKKVEDMRTEDFLNSVENSDLHKIDPSTVVRIEPVTDPTAAKGKMKITLSYGDQRNHQINGGDNNKKTSSAATACKSQHQVEIESGAEHPYFVFGRGWASCSPTKTLAKYGLTCQRLQVGDVCVSLTKRTSAAADSTTTSTMTTTLLQGGSKRLHQLQHQQPQPLSSMAVHQQQPHNNHNQQQQLHQQHHYHNSNSINNTHHSTTVQKAQIQLHRHHHHQQQQQIQQLSADDDKNGRNKRRWSAPDPEPAT